ncbi:MAG: carotenoid biosynthesis protein [Syntrophorhabdaceae bacterium]|nr:carotenoid biosynthesis protein [Syntrophorhabdaceae bacterium]
MELFDQIAGTILLRPYFVAFLLVYFFACTLHLGFKRALLFAAAGYCIAWASEYSSIHNGIPYGLYYYIHTTQGRELWVLGIPFMDSMSFVFLSYASYSLALFALSPAIRDRGIYLLENNSIRHSMKVRLLGALFCMCLDVIIDPVALQGSRWFLGQIYGYTEKGFYFGIPVSNFIGWFVVGFFLIYALQLIDRLLTSKRVKDCFCIACTWRYLPGPALYFSVVIFNLSVTFIIGEYSLFWTGIFIVLLPLTLFVLIQRIRLDRAVSDKDIEAHLRDFPEAAMPGRARVINPDLP